MNDIVFIIGSNDFHAMDKYWLTARFVYPRKVILLTDTIEYSGMPKLIKDHAAFERLFIIDKFLLKQYTSFGNFWRNLIKLIFIPIQLYRLKIFFNNNRFATYHAIPMYYMFLCYLARIQFIATPQASEILVRPNKSKLYKLFAIKTLKSAKLVIVDSIQMQKKVFELSGINSLVFKNGFDVQATLENTTLISERTEIISIRGLNPFYRIHEIFNSREESKCINRISLIYPSEEVDYKNKINKLLKKGDQDLGKLSKVDLYNLMKKTVLAISIPNSDSSPRSVYECIFSGAIVAVVYSPFIDELPQCMRNRIFIIDLKNKNWFREAIDFANIAILDQFIPSESALDFCDEQRTIKNIVDQVYN